MKKVALLVLNNFVGDSRVLKEAISLQRNGYEAHVVAYHDEGLKTNETTKDGVSVKRIKLKSKSWSKKQFIQIFKYLEFISVVIRKYRSFDIFHCNDIGTLPIGVITKWIFNRDLKVVYDAHELETELSFVKNKIQKNLIKKTESFFIRYADTVITVSPSIAKFYTEQYGVQPELIYNCPGYQTVKRNNALREKLNISENKKIFLYIGGMINGRLIPEIMDAFKNLQDNNKIVIFVGNGGLATMVQEAANKYKQIYYHPAVPHDELVNIASSADWSLVLIENISLSYYYSMPNKLFESIMAELPVIVTPMLELKRVATENHIGIVTKGSLSNDILDAVERTGDFKTGKVFHQNILSLKKEFSWEKQELKLISLYNRLYIEK